MLLNREKDADILHGRENCGGIRVNGLELKEKVLKMKQDEIDSQEANSKHMQETGVMGFLEEILATLESSEANRNAFEKSIFAVLSSYKDYEEYVETVKTTEKKFRKCYLELESREKNLNSVEESVRRSYEDLKLLRQQVEESVRVRIIENEENRLVGLGVKEKEWEESKEKLVEELREKERKLNEKEVLINGISEKLELEKNELVGLEKLVEERIGERRKEIKLIEDGILKRLNELDEREKKVKEREKIVNLKGLEDSLMEDRERLIEMKEKEERLIKQDLELKEKEIDKLLVFHDHRVKVFDMKEKQFDAKQKELEMWEKRFQVKKKEYMDEKELLNRGNEELELRKRDFQCSIKNLKELEMVGENLEAKRRELKGAEKCLKECLIQNKQCLSDKKLLEYEIEVLKVKKNELEDRITHREKQLEVEKKELEEVAQERLKECRLKEKRWQLEKESWEKRNKEIELKMKDYEDKIKLFEIRDKFEVELKKLNDELRAREPVKEAVNESMNSGSSPKFALSVKLDGQDVLMSLNGFKIDLSSKDEVLKALRKSGAPAYMVLKATESLYPPYLKKLDMKFEGTVARSCVVLLEQLTRLAPTIQSRERDHALRLACEWKAMMLTRNSFEVLGFLYLLASFHLASAFNAEELLKLVETAAEHPQIPALCGHLGLKDNIPGLIQNLLKVTKHYLQAIELIYAFELVDQFPPVPILKQYLKQVKRTAKVMPRTRNNMFSDDFDQRISAVKVVLGCILEHKLESQYSPKELENTIRQLSMQKVQQKCPESVVPSNAQVQREVEGRETPLGSGYDVNLAAKDLQEVEVENTSSTDLPGCSRSGRMDPEFPNTEICPPNAMVLILSNMNGKNMLSFLDTHLVDHQLLESELFTALQISDDSAKLVLDVVEGFYSSYPLWEQGSRSCILLLKQLMRISPLISVEVKNTAQKIALDLKAKITAEYESSLVILVFLLFTNGFSLISAFDAGEIRRLYKILSEDSSLLALCQSLGISKLISGSVHPEIQVQQISTEDSQLDIKSAISTMSLEKGIHAFHSNDDMESGAHGIYCNRIPRFLQHSSDPALLVLDALEFCYFSNSQQNKINQLIAQSFFYLLKQLLNVSPRIEPCVKRRALKVAHSWKSSLSGSNSWEVLAFMQLVVVYGVSSSFSAKCLLGLLEVPPKLLKEASTLIRILGLEYKVPGFVTALIAKKQPLLAFEYVFEFNLVDKIPPVELLKNHVLQAKMAAMEICKDEKATLQEQDRAIFDEISALKEVMKCILDRGLQNEYSPDALGQRVAQLETQRANLKASLSAVPLSNSPKLDNDKRGLCASGKARSEQENTRKHPASSRGIAKWTRLPPSKKFRL
ncbi:OLC1v1000637C1 [Oldenlandia corymbosa var. corymbosa]|uniref:OLC1v1000637C1 n=1 Tax=Oldenlandia corymbosa var. corymbosa TaxID=529605 RepID=A0AAV1D5K5_OLDCO|nr:OLC1v1000637C1 [Oldenlandia corymbosa var. corymbosa]